MENPNGNAVKYRILVIDDEPIVAMSCDRILRQGDFYEIQLEYDPLQGLKKALTGTYDIILLDLVMPDLDGLEILKRLKTSGISSEVIIITGYATIKTAVEAMKLGAADYISKPFTPDELNIVVRKVIKHSDLLKENIALRNELHLNQGFEGIIGDTRGMEKVFALMKRVAPTDGTILITGESGTGKDIIATALHRLSKRNHRPFVACDCSSLAPTLLESELFGHIKGSFSGAIANKKGLFEIADNGTLFLDEVSNISLETQGKLLRVLENQHIRKVGDVSEIKINIRLIVATNRDLHKMIGDGTFRDDLFYRLQGVPIHIPPLRERKGDIPKLALTFLERFSKKNIITARDFSPESIELMESYSWPGNVRELKNLVERMAILSQKETIEPYHFPEEITNMTKYEGLFKVPQTWDEFGSLRQRIRDDAVRNFEIKFLIEAMRRSHGNISRAADEVGIQRTNLHLLLKKHGIQAKDWK